MMRDDWKALLAQWHAAVQGGDADGQDKARADLHKWMRQHSAAMRAGQAQNAAEKTANDAIEAAAAATSDADALAALLAAEPPPEAPRPMPTAVPLSKVRGEPPQPVIWRDRGMTPGGWHRAPWPLVSAGEPGILAAPGGVGKSYLTLSVAVAAAAADDGAAAPVFGGGLTVRGGPVVVLAWEDSPESILWRASYLPETSALEAAARAHALERVHLIPDAGPLWQGDPDRRGRIGPADGWAALCTAVERIRPSLVIIDPAGAALTDVDASQAPAVRRFLGALAGLGRTDGHPPTGVLIVAHTTKAAHDAARDGGDPGAGAVAGSAAWHDAPRAVAYLHNIEGGRLLEVMKANYGPRGWGVELRPAWRNGDPDGAPEDGDFCGFAAAGGGAVLAPGDVRERKAAAADARKAEARGAGGGGRGKRRRNGAAPADKADHAAALAADRKELIG